MGVEPTTFGLEVQRASPLRHAGLFKLGNFYNFFVKKNCVHYANIRKQVAIISLSWYELISSVLRHTT